MGKLTEMSSFLLHLQPATYSSPVLAQSSRAHDLYQVKMVIQAHSKRSHEVQPHKVTSQVPIKVDRTNHNVNQAETKARADTASRTSKYFFTSIAI